jgi:hypothetical protein
MEFRWWPNVGNHGFDSYNQDSFLVRGFSGRPQPAFADLTAILVGSNFPPMGVVLHKLVEDEERETR